MIRLIKLPKPQILVDNESIWRNRLLEDIRSNVKHVYKYNHSEIKDTLINETYDKCAYCESKITHSTFGDIDHILPKAHVPQFCYQWSNMTFACEICNRKYKKDYYVPHSPLLNPYIDNVDKHIYEIGAITFANTPKGKLSIEKYGLFRPALIERREERLDHIKLFLEIWKNSYGNTKNILEAQIKKEYENRAEFSSTVKWFLMNNGFPV